MRRSEIHWSGEAIELATRQLTAANGRRRARLLGIEDVRAIVQNALNSRNFYAWGHAGTVDDARESTSVCLAVVTDEGVAVGIADTRANGATPDRAWADLAGWDRSIESANIARCLAWAGRQRNGGIFLPFPPARTFTGDPAELLLAICDDPEADEPRLVLADALSERGDPRGEFILVQCELERLDARSPRAEQLRARESELLTEFGAKWVDALAQGGSIDVTSVTFRRGFVHSVTLHDAAPLEKSPQFFEREPFVELHLRSSKGLDMAALAAQPWLSRVRVLSFESAGFGNDRLGAEHAHALLESRRLLHLRELAFLGQHLDNVGALVLARNVPHAAPALEKLTLAHDQVSEVGVHGLMGARWVGSLHELSLAHNQLRAGGAEAVASARIPGKLQVLNLDSNSIGDDGARALAASPRLETLRELSLRRNNIGSLGIEALLASPFLKALQVLEVTGNTLGARVRPLYERRFPPRPAR